jgi:hypothetical protein
MKRRKNLYIDIAVCEEIEALARKPGANESRIVSDAMREWLVGRRSRKLDDTLRLRLDRMSREISAFRRDHNVHFEGFMLFVQYLLAVLPPLADGDAAGIAAGQERFNRFINQLGRVLAAGRTAVAPREGEEREQ